MRSPSCLASLSRLARNRHGGKDDPAPSEPQSGFPFVPSYCMWRRRPRLPSHQAKTLRRLLWQVSTPPHHPRRLWELFADIGKLLFDLPSVYFSQVAGRTIVGAGEQLRELWRHSGFSVKGGTRIYDKEARQGLCQYILRAPLAMQKLLWDQDTVTWRSSPTGYFQGKEVHSSCLEALVWSESRSESRLHGRGPPTETGSPAVRRACKCADHFTKPFLPGDLVRKVNEILAR
jgi:hypothetical protein